MLLSDLFVYIQTSLEIKKNEYSQMFYLSALYVTLRIE